MNGGLYVSPDFVQLDQYLIYMDFLSELPSGDWQQILARSIRQVTLQPRQILYQQDESLDYVYILLKGTVVQAQDRFSNDGQPQICQRQVDVPGTMLSLYDLLFYDTYHTTTRHAGSGPCDLLRIDATAFNRLIFRFPQLRQRLAPMDQIRRLRTVPMIGQPDLVLVGFLAEVMESMTVSAGEYVYSTGELPDRVFFVNQGQVKLEWDDGSVAWAANGAAFGFAEPHGRSHSRARPMRHTACATTKSKIFSIPYDQFHSISGLDPDVDGLANLRKRSEVVNGLTVFSQLTEEQRGRLVGFFSHYCFPINQLLVQQGEQADSFWVLLEGGRATIQALDKDGKKLTSTISYGQTYFCETALLGEVSQASSVEAMAESEWLRLHWTDFQHFNDDEHVEIRGKLEISTEKLKELESQKKQQQHSWLQPGELLIVLSRRHWIAFLRKGIPAFIALLILIGLGYIGSRIAGYQWWVILPTAFLIVAGVILFTWGAVDYFNDWIAVTNRRVVYQEKVLLISRVRKEAPLDQIQQIDEDRTFLGGLLNYGTTVIQTASTAGKITFTYTRNFEALNNAVRQQQEERQRHSAAESKTAISHTLSDRLGHNLVLPSRVWQTVKSVPKEDGSRRFLPRLRRNHEYSDDERIIWRKHWIVLLPKLWWALLILLFTVGLVILFIFIDPIIPETLPGLRWVARFGVGMLFLVALAQVVWVIINWYNDTYEVDDRRITHIEKLPFGLRQSTSGALLERIQNVSSEIPSTINWLFNYGNVRCQTAAEDGDFTFEGVHAPRDVADIIQLRMENYRRREEEATARRRAAEFPDWFEIYHRMETDDMPL